MLLGDPLVFADVDYQVDVIFHKNIRFNQTVDEWEKSCATCLHRLGVNDWVMRAQYEQLPVITLSNTPVRKDAYSQLRRAAMRSAIELSVNAWGRIQLQYGYLEVPIVQVLWETAQCFGSW